MLKAMAAANIAFLDVVGGTALEGRRDQMCPDEWEMGATRRRW